MTALTESPIHDHRRSENGELRAQHYLAILGLAFIAYQMVGWIRWLADGPVQLVRYRDPLSLSWKVCRFYEVATILTAAIILYFVIRKCLRERTLTFDMMFCLACFSLYWQDPMANLFQPLFLWSQNWTNLNDWMGYLPFNPNPDAGRNAEPILQDGLNYLVAWLGFAMILNGAMRSWQRRYPRATRLHLLIVAFVLGAFIDIALETPMYVFETWEFPGGPDFGIMASTGHKFPGYEFISGAIMFSLVSGVRYFRDDQGLTILERGLGMHPLWQRKVVTLCAMIGLFNIGYLLDNSVYWMLGTFSAPFKYMPAHIVAGACDAPGWSGTRYGACPGSRGYRMPLMGTHSLQGDLANNNAEWLNGPKQCSTCELKMIDGAVVTSPPPARQSPASHQ